MRYVERVFIDPSIGSAGSYVYSANGMYDPNVTGTGHQPYGFDQWMLFYNHYTVLSSTIHVQFSNVNGATSVQDKNVGVQLKASPTIDASDVNLILEQGSTVMKFLPRISTGVANVRYAYDARRFFGVPTITDDIYRGTTSANPAEQAYYHVFSELTDGGGDQIQILALVTIEYRALLSEPKPLVGS